MQVRHMDVIYAHAQLTIIAASGRDSDYGLPGVSVRPRIPFQRQRLDDVELVEIGPYKAGPPPVWATRGW